MPIGRSAKKSLRKARSNQKTNVAFRNKLKAAVKAFLAKPSEKAMIETQSILDKSVKNHIWSKNKVSRMKSSMVKKVNSKEEVKTVTKKAVTKKTTPKKTAKRTVKAKMSK